MRRIFFLWFGWVAVAQASLIFLNGEQMCALNVAGRTVGDILPADLDGLDLLRVEVYLRSELRVSDASVEAFAKLRRVFFLLPDEHRLFLVFAHRLDGRPRISNLDLGQLLGVSNKAVYARHGRISQILSPTKVKDALSFTDEQLAPEQSLYRLGIPQSIVKRLFDHTIYTVDQLCQMRAESLNNIAGFGDIRVAEIRMGLAALGRKLAGE